MKWPCKNPGMSSHSIMAPFEESICWDWERRFSRKIDSQERFTSVERFAPQASQERFAPKASEERFAPKDELASQESNAISGKCPEEVTNGEGR